jgi:large subunit ribosomal protein L24
MANPVKAKLARIAASQPQRKPRLKVRKGDRVLVISGPYRGETGRVIDVEPEKNRARVEGVNIRKRHQKADRARGRQGGIVEAEAPIHISNLKVLDPTTGQPTRVGRKVLEDGTIVRYSKASGAVIDKQS